MRGKLCGAKTRAGTPCKRFSGQPQGRRRLQGGCSLYGFAHPNFGTGRRSKYVAWLAPAVEAKRARASLIGLRGDGRLAD
jgi:hypothetical protein